jgi:hypothetical protein
MSDCNYRGIVVLGQKLGVSDGQTTTECGGDDRHFLANRDARYRVCERHIGEFLYWYRNAVETDATVAPVPGGMRGMYADGD